MFERLIQSIPHLVALCPEQIVSLAGDGHGRNGSRVVVVDQWGRSHSLHDSFEFGREPSPPGLAVFEGSVSRVHARLCRDGAVWSLEDRNSTNGTYVDGNRINGQTLLGPGHLVVLGDVGLVFLADASSAELKHITESIRATASHRALGQRVLRLAETAAGSGGVATLGDFTTQLGATQFALLKLLAERAIEERDLPAETRGYVRSIELMKMLPWESRTPQDNHVKQLVRRTRRAFGEVGRELIEARQRFGYRLAVPPLIT